MIMSGDSTLSKEKSVVVGHQTTQTSQAKWVCIENIYQKLHRPNFFNIGGTYHRNLADFWFLCKTERVGCNFLLHLFVCNKKEVESFGIAMSFSNDLQFDRQNAIAYLSWSLKEHLFENVKEKSHSYITTYNFSDFEVDLLKDKQLYIAVSISSESKGPIKQNYDDIKLKHDFQQLLSDPVGYDFIIESQDGEKFKVHKVLLNSYSEVFKAMLKDDTAESLNNYVKLTDVKTEDLHRILEFLYTGTLKNIEQCNLVNLLMLADQYNIRGLLELCQHCLSQQLTKENVFDTLAVADMYNADILKTSALKFVKSNVVVLHSTSYN